VVSVQVVRFGFDETDQAVGEVGCLRPSGPAGPSVRALPGRPAAALGFALRGDTERARQIAFCWFAPPPRSWAWTQAIAFWAQVAAALGVPDPGWLYDQLTPHAGELAVVGVGGDCGGAADSLLAGLAWRWRPRVGSRSGSTRPQPISRIKTAP
jgi:hypothetical protein